MPLYLYQNEETGEIKEILQGMNDKHEYYQDGIAWKRIFTIPNASIDTTIDPHSAKDFVNKTGSKKGTVGDMMDLSAELSEKRASATGEDPVKRKFFDDYKKKNKGKKHLKDTPKKIETKSAIIEF